VNFCSNVRTYIRMYTSAQESMFVLMQSVFICMDAFSVFLTTDHISHYVITNFMLQFFFETVFCQDSGLSDPCPLRTQWLLKFKCRMLLGQVDEQTAHGDGYVG
jgi:hypothetical protein